MFESIILGAIQGVTEWLPISSEGMIVLVKTNFFGGGSLQDAIRTALFLHLGTFLAALIYFREDVKKIYLWIIDFASSRSGASPTPGELCRLSTGDRETGKILRFIIIATFVSAVLGWALLKFLSDFEGLVLVTGRYVNIAIAVLLAVTGLMQLKATKNGHKKAVDLKNQDGFILGLVQGVAVLPGLSRSGLTVSALLLKDFEDTESLRLSFLLSLPIVLAGNIVLNFNQAVFSQSGLVGLLTAFVFGYATIHLFIKLAGRVNFGWFAVIFAALLILSVLF